MNRRFFFIEAINDDVNLFVSLSINANNSNTESQQLLTLTELHKILQNVVNIGNKNIIMGWISIFTSIQN